MRDVLTKLWGLRWWMMGLLMVGSIVNYLTRSTLSVAAPTRDDGSRYHHAAIFVDPRAFQFAIMLQPICGYAIDTIGLKLGFALFADRLVVHQHGARLGGQLADPRRPARAAGICGRFRQPGRHESDVGMVSRQRTGFGRRRLQHRRFARLDAGAAAGRVGDPDHNWQTAFVLTGALGLVWVASGCCSTSRPRNIPRFRTPNASTSWPGRKSICKATARPSIGSILNQRNFWGIALPRFLADPTWGTLAFWLPLYLTRCADSI